MISQPGDCFTWDCPRKHGERNAHSAMSPAARTGLSEESVTLPECGKTAAVGARRLPLTARFRQDPSGHFGDAPIEICRCVNMSTSRRTSLFAEDFWRCRAVQKTGSHRYRLPLLRASARACRKDKFPMHTIAEVLATERSHNAHRPNLPVCRALA